MKFYKPNYLMMTAGPTMVAGNVLFAREKFFGNPDLDDDFFEFYKDLTERLKTIFGTEKNDIIIMNGEGMLGLDSACASIIEPGDRVLVISNGVFGEGFKELVENYGGEVVLFKSSWKKSVDLDELKLFLNGDLNFKCATIVHCDTPSGILNNIEPICKYLHSNGILTIVDTVAGVGGVEFDMDNWGIDIALGGSQKVLSAPPGLTIMGISQKAWDIIENRKTRIPSYYCNLKHWKNCVKNRYFPYTMPASDIMGLSVAVDNLLSEWLFIFDRHINARDLCIEKLKELGCELYLESDFSPTVTAFIPPKNIEPSTLIKHMKDKYNILLAGSYEILSNKIVRIGHMGENSREDRVLFTLECLEKSIRDLL